MIWGNRRFMNALMWFTLRRLATQRNMFSGFEFQAFLFKIKVDRKAANKWFSVWMNDLLAWKQEKHELPGDTNIRGWILLPITQDISQITLYTPRLIVFLLISLHKGLVHLIPLRLRCSWSMMSSCLKLNLSVFLCETWQCSRPRSLDDTTGPHILLH